jgi:hypothetical protein
MQYSGSRATWCIFLGIVFQSFCSIKLIGFNSLLVTALGEKFVLSDYSIFLGAWAVVTFISRIIGAYTLGKYAEAKGFLIVQRILILGYLLTTFLLFICCSCASNFSQIRPLLLVIAFFNACLFPATLVLPAMYLMKIYDLSSHVKISMLAISSSVIGYVLSCVISARCSTQAMSAFLFGGSLLCGVIYYLGKDAISNLGKSPALQIKKHLQILPTYVAKILAALVGVVCGAGLSHNYFFIEPYALNISIVNADHFKLVYTFFYSALGAFLIFATKICKYVNYKKLMFWSLICILLLEFGLKMLNVPSTYAYLVYQVLFAFFFAGFLAPSLSLIFSLFQTHSFFNGTVWYYFGFSTSYLAGYFLSKQLGIFPQYFLLASPLIFNGILCVLAMIVTQFIYSSSQKCEYNVLTCSRNKKLNLDTIGKCW